MINIIFLGPPGSGKGTQASFLSEKLGIPTISTGEILRQEVLDQTETGLLAKGFMDSGSLVPDEVVVDIIKKRITQSDCDRGFILDGFPRNESQAFVLDDELYAMNKSISTVINLEVSDSVIVKRIVGRFSCSECNALYNKFFNNTRNDGVCDECGSRSFVSRDDDNRVAIVNRLKVYHKNTDELIKFYEKKGLIYKVDGLKPIGLINESIVKIVLSSDSKEKLEVINN